jgi:hypothetical protein
VFFVVVCLGNFATVTTSSFLRSPIHAENKKLILIDGSNRGSIGGRTHSRRKRLENTTAVCRSLSYVLRADENKFD